jgi:bacillithiol system protein YtxJ
LKAEWQTITREGELDELIDSGHALLILKHSPRCSLSFMAKSRLERHPEKPFDCCLIDVIEHRSVSNALADKTGVRHESPQAFLFSNGRLLAVRDHMAIRPDFFVSALEDAKSTTGI